MQFGRHRCTKNPLETWPKPNSYFECTQHFLHIVGDFKILYFNEFALEVLSDRLNFWCIYSQKNSDESYQKLWFWFNGVAAVWRLFWANHHEKWEAYYLNEHRLICTKLKLCFNSLGLNATTCQYYVIVRAHPTGKRKWHVSDSHL